jgi:predicted component of type VI protein secretion system
VHRCRVPETTRSLDDPWPVRLATLVRADGTTDPFTREVALALAPLLYGAPGASAFSRALRIVSSRWLGGAPIALAQRTGGRVLIDRSSRACLGATRLGDTAVLGQTVDDPSSRATVTIGPLDASFARALDRDQRAHRALQLVIAWLGDSACEIEVVVHSEDAHARVGGARLGRSMLGSRPGRLRARHVVLDATG